jgi:hypothetical protein
VTTDRVTISERLLRLSGRDEYGAPGAIVCINREAMVGRTYRNANHANQAITLSGTPINLR